MKSTTRSGGQESPRKPVALTEQESWELAKRLTEGDLNCCDALMAELGSPPPLMRWNPSFDDMMVSEALRHLAVWWWQAAEAGGGPPSPDAVDPLLLRPALGAVSLLDVYDGGRDFRIRLHGSIVSGALGMDMTGMLVSKMDVPFMAFLMVAYRAQVLRPEPLLLRYTPASEFFDSGWWRIGLPLARDGEVVRLMVGMERAPRQPTP